MFNWEDGIVLFRFPVCCRCLLRIYVSLSDSFVENDGIDLTHSFIFLLDEVLLVVLVYRFVFGKSYQFLWLHQYIDFCYVEQTFQTLSRAIGSQSNLS